MTVDIQNAASVIKATVDMQTVLGLYGYQAKHGKMVCPFHADKNASLQIYQNNGRHSGWHCFGCGRGGSVLDFVMEHENCDFITAVKAVDNALGLQLMETKNLFDIAARKHEQELYDRIRESFDSYYDKASEILDDLFRDSFDMLRVIEDKTVQERTAEEWTLREILTERLKYIDHLQETIQDNKRKVTAWRNQARRARSD